MDSWDEMATEMPTEKATEMATVTGHGKWPRKKLRKNMEMATGASGPTHGILRWVFWAQCTTFRDSALKQTTP